MTNEESGLRGWFGLEMDSGELKSQPKWLCDSVPLVRRLTPRELQVFYYLGHGFANRSISQELQISERTVKRHVTAILEKLALESRLQAGLVSFVISRAGPRCSQSSSPFDASP